jgi:Putative zinc-finger
MNASFDHHFSEAVWEEYAMGMQSEEDCQSLEEHLLICPACQDLLAEADDYIQIAKAAMGLAEGTRRRLSKPVASAVTLASALLLLVIR